jgi:hypothetical protein
MSTKQNTKPKSLTPEVAKLVACFLHNNLVEQMLVHLGGRELMRNPESCKMIFFFLKKKNIDPHFLLLSPVPSWPGSAKYETANPSGILISTRTSEYFLLKKTKQKRNKT